MQCLENYRNIWGTVKIPKEVEGKCNMPKQSFPKSEKCSTHQCSQCHTLGMGKTMQKKDRKKLKKQNQIKQIALSHY